ncbi:MAG: hypothetical protein ACYS71_04885, partial [Planctomycetota bacterium]
MFYGAGLSEYGGYNISRNEEGGRELLVNGVWLKEKWLAVAAGGWMRNLQYYAEPVTGVSKYISELEAATASNGGRLGPDVFSESCRFLF